MFAKGMDTLRLATQALRRIARLYVRSRMQRAPHNPGSQFRFEPVERAPESLATYGR